MNRYGIKKIISGGQTGADRGGLDAAIELGIPHGGWCPKGRKAEDGVIPAKYRLKEHVSPEYPPRTALNIYDADATLIFKRGEMGRGSRLTFSLAQSQKRSCLIVDIVESLADQEDLWVWLGSERPKILNVAGTRESHAPGMQESVRRILVEALGE
jgi:Circularly permutated YpsA SLOG family